MRTLLQDLRYGLRMSLRSPGFTLVAAGTLAIGIAANTTVFSWLNMMILRPIPGAARDNELAAFETVAADGTPLTTSYADFRDYRDNLKLFSGLAAANPALVNIGDADHAARAWGELVSGNYFDVLGVRPALGRFFLREERGDKPGAYPVAILGYSLWKRQFAGDPQAIGTTLLVNRQPFTIVGVAPAGFHGSVPGLFLELWLPITMGTQIGLVSETALADRNARMFLAVGRLGRGVTLQQARAECAALARRLGESNPRTNLRIGATVLPIRKGHFGGQTMMEGPLQILMAACGVLFLVVCANVANLLLARATVRRKEFGVRAAIGAGRARLARHLLVETLILAALAVFVGVPLAMWMSEAIGYLMPRGANLPVSLSIPLNTDILSFTVMICVAACVAAGLAPALQAARVSLNDVLKEGGRSGNEGARSKSLRGALVASEVALALVAVISAGLFAKSFQIARRIDPGFDPRNVLLAHVDLGAATYTAADRKQFCERLRERIASQPGVVAASWAETIPLWFTGVPLETVQVEGYVPRLNESMKIARDVVAPGYFDLLRIPLLDGRDFNNHDTDTSKRVMIVNQTFAARFFGGGSPIGRRVHAFGEWHTVAGVVRNSKYVKPTEAAQPFFFVPLRQAFSSLMNTLYVRTSGEPEGAAATVRREVRALDPGVRVFDAMPMTEAITASLFGHKMATVLLAVLGFAALALAATGLYSVIAYSVAQRTQEIGIRIALGARPSDVIAMVVRQGMRLTLVGLSIGLAVAIAVTRFAAAVLVNVSATDPAVFCGAAVFLAMVALAACYLPALRATHVDPYDALRSE